MILTNPRNTLLSLDVHTFLINLIIYHSGADLSGAAAPTRAAIRFPVIIRTCLI